MIIGEFEAAVQKITDAGDPMQFALSGTVRGEKVREVFTVSDADQTMAWGLFARASMSGLDTADMESLGALIDILEGIVIEEDQPRLISTAKKIHLDPETLLKVVQSVMEAQSGGRPTEQPSDSSGGSSTTTVKSTAVSSSEDTTSGEMEHIPGDPRAEGLMSVDKAALTLLTGS